MDITVHCEPRIEWQSAGAHAFVKGLRQLGLSATISRSRVRESDVAILLGTTCWREIEHDGDWLLVDRASVGDPEFVQLVWNGHGRRGDHCVPDGIDESRWRELPFHVEPWRHTGERVVLCGQTESYSPHYDSLNQWYEKVAAHATHFRPHPVGANPTGLDETTSWYDVERVITLNSSVGVESVMRGIPTVTMDDAAMAWQVTSHDPQKSVRPKRIEWLSWLAWTQWSWHEIQRGEPIRHLFEEM